MKRAKKQASPMLCGRPEFVMIVHSQLTAEDLFYPVDTKAKLIDGQLVRIPGIRFIETMGVGNG